MSQSNISSQEDAARAVGSRKRKLPPSGGKGADWYAAQHSEDFIARPVTRDGELVQALVCRFCDVTIGHRTDRIREHLGSKRHQARKKEVMMAAGQGGGQVEGQEAGHGEGALLAVPALGSGPPSSAPPKLIKMENPGQPQGKDQEGGLVGGHRQLPKTMTPPPTRGGSRVARFPGGGLRRGGPTANRGNNGVRGSPHGFASSPRRPTTSTPKRLPVPAPAQKKPEMGFKVKWEDFESNLVGMFCKQRELGHFLNVTLSCEGKSIQCHQLVLAASSDYFDEMLRANPNPHPIFILNNLRLWEVEALVEYMYRGEVVVPMDQLGDLTRAAKSLQIKGLLTLTPDDTEGLDQLSMEGQGQGHGGNRGNQTGRGRPSPSPGGSRMDLNNRRDLDAAIAVGIAKGFQAGTATPSSSGASSPVSRAGGSPRTQPRQGCFRKSGPGNGNLPNGWGLGRGGVKNSNGGKMESDEEAPGDSQPIDLVKVQNQGNSNHDDFDLQQSQEEIDNGLQDPGNDQEMEMDQQEDGTASSSSTSSSSSRRMNDNSAPPTGNGNGMGRGRNGK